MSRDDYKYKYDSDYTRTPRNTDAELDDYDMTEKKEDAARYFMNKVYNWMTVGLLISGALSWFVAVEMLANEQSLFRSGSFMLFMFVLEIGLVIGLSAAISKLPLPVAILMFLVFSAVNGITLAPVFLIYTGQTVAAAFVVSAGTFAAMSIFGYLTKMDLSGVGAFCTMAVFGIVIATCVNMFIGSHGFSMIIAYVGVFIFIGLTAWDTQKLKRLGADLAEGNAARTNIQKYAVIGALELYLDFINMFLMLLRIFGGNSRR